MPPHRFEVLDSWRGICALMVALLHFEAFSHLKDMPFFNDTYLFVDFFFVLSGFVIAANYQARLGNGFGVTKFMLLRFGRLYPLYFVMLIAFLRLKSLMVGAEHLLPHENRSIRCLPICFYSRVSAFMIFSLGTRRVGALLQNFGRVCSSLSLRLGGQEN